jgi:hypothetical protein
VTATAVEERPSWEEVVVSFAPVDRRSVAFEFIRRANLPLIVILLFQSVLTWRLSDIASDDEALYIDAGHDLINHVLDGTHLSNYGNYLSGAPNAYPVPAALLDSLGGLVLVRLFSLFLLLLSTVCVYRVARTLFSRRSGLCAAFLFSVSGSVLFIGKLATYDAPCLALIAVGLYVAVCRRGLWSGVVCGACLALAAVTKYAGAGFAPFVIGLAIVCGMGTAPRVRVLAVLRGVVAAGTTIVLLLAAYRLWGGSVSAGLKVTTTGRRAIDYRPDGVLLRSLSFDVGLLAVLAVVGAAIAVRRRMAKQGAASVLCIGAAAFLPLSQLRIHEFVSLDKHTAFSALFLAIPAGSALAWLSRANRVSRVATVVLVWIVVVNGLWRSEVQYSWPSSLLTVLSLVQRDPVPGVYLSTDGDAARYYSGDTPEIRWTTSSSGYSLFDQGERAVVDAIASGRYAGFVYRTGDDGTGPETETAATAYLAGDDRYRLVGHFRQSPYVPYVWYVWQRRGTTGGHGVSAEHGSASTEVASPGGPASQLSLHSRAGGHPTRPSTGQ